MLYQLFYVAVMATYGYETSLRMRVDQTYGILVNLQQCLLHTVLK
jgi:hypothetical protein